MVASTVGYEDSNGDALVLELAMVKSQRLGLIQWFC